MLRWSVSKTVELWNFDFETGFETENAPENIVQGHLQKLCHKRSFLTRLYSFARQDHDLAVHLQEQSWHSIVAAVPCDLFLSQ